MSNNASVDQKPLVGLEHNSVELLVPAVTTVVVPNEDRSTIGKGNITKPGEVFDRDVLIGVFDIATTDTPYVNLTGDFDVFMLYQSNHLISKYLSPFQFASFDLVVTVKLIAPGACYGCYNVQFLADGGKLPPGVDEHDGAGYDSYLTSTQDVHVFMNVDIKNDAVVELPWEHYLDSIELPTVTEIGCWRLLIWALAPIQNSVSDVVSRGQIQIFAHMGANRNFESLRYQGKKLKMKDKMPTGKSSEEDPKWASKGLGKLASGVGMLGGMFPMIAEYALPAAAGLAAVSSIADAFGFTRESQPMPAEPVVMRSLHNLANYDAPDISDVAALSIANSLSIDPTAGGGDSIDQLSFAALFERWTIIGTPSVTTSTSLTEPFFRIPVTPYAYDSILGVSYPTIGGYVGAPFANWRGGMEYMIYIPSCPNIQGSLQILWDPTTSMPVYLNDPTNLLANVIIDLKGTSRTHLLVDYTNCFPCCRSNFLPVNTSGDAASQCGQLVFKMMAPLTAPRVTGYDLKIIIMARPSADMRFGNPSQRYTQNGVESSLNNLRYQGKDGDDDEEIHMVQLTVSKPYPCKEFLFGEEVLSVRALIQKPSPIGGVDNTGNEIVWQQLYPHYPPAPYNSAMSEWTDNPDIPDTPYFTYYGFYLAWFTGVRGSTRWKFGGAEANHPYIMGAVPAVNAQGTSVLQTVSTIFLPTPIVHSYAVAGGNTSAMEVTVPAYSTVKYYQPRGTNNVNSFNRLTRYDFLAVLRPSSTNLSGWPLYTCAGPDVSVTRFRRTPGLLFL